MSIKRNCDRCGKLCTISENNFIKQIDSTYSRYSNVFLCGLCMDQYVRWFNCTDYYLDR